jgi:hypothetical protein
VKGKMGCGEVEEWDLGGRRQSRLAATADPAGKLEKEGKAGFSPKRQWTAEAPAGLLTAPPNSPTAPEPPKEAVFVASAAAAALPFDDASPPLPPPFFAQ